MAAIDTVEPAHSVRKSRIPATGRTVLRDEPVGYEKPRPLWEGAGLSNGGRGKD